ncbi:MAG: phosphonate metabolism transcriptional regulator PhnF [Rhodospirillales bacterium]|nr:MAG: phosphonate metabolism transcriptional regulator PhnF [Rhodospirillales bacterium]
MEIGREPGVAVWHQIEQTLFKEISTGKPGPGERIPNETEIAERFGVNRHTVRRAVAALVSKGILRIQRGHGTFVEEGVIDYAIGKRTRFSANILRHHKEPGHRILRGLEVAGMADVNKALKLGANSRLIMLETIGEADGRPISVSTNYLPAARFPGFIEAYESLQSMTKVLRKFGINDYTRRVTRVTTRMPSAADAEHLKQPQTRPILVAESVDVDGRDVPIVYHEVRFSGERVQLVFEP